MSIPFSIRIPFIEQIGCQLERHDSGHAEISVTDKTGTRTVISQLGKGDVFGVMSILTGERLSADMLGDENDPAVLLVPDLGQSRSAWRDVAEALVLSGRRVVNLDLRGGGTLTGTYATNEQLQDQIADELRDD